MKLLAKYNRVNLITTIIVMLVTGIIYYQAISYILIDLVDKNLLNEEQEILDNIHLNHRLPQVFATKDQQTKFQEVPKGSVQRQFINTVYYNSKEKEYESGRGLITSVVIGGKYYKITIVESKVETDDLIQMIFAITIGVILLLLLVLFITNRLILNRLWQPFRSIMRELRSFNLTDNKEIPQVNTSIDEFKELNKAVITMSSRVKNDYSELKTFAENASHELLTPIAVINSKLDTLIQTDNFSQQQSKLLNDLYSSVSRLTRLNQSLLLLVKIENKLVHDYMQIDLRSLIEEMIIQFEEIFQDKELVVTCSLNDKEVYASSYLIETLLNNLISNAIRHNHIGGAINIILTDKHLIIQNTGESQPLSQEKIFTRFNKSPNSEGSGLGLTISKQICENFNFAFNYEFQSPYHTFTINFNI